MIGLETIEQRRDRLWLEHGRANADRTRAEFWARKVEQGEGATPLARDEGES